MNVRRTDYFIADVEQQFEWYVHNGGSEIANRYLKAIEVTCSLIGTHPLLGPVLQTKHSQLEGWRFFVVFRPFNKHILFYEIRGNEVIMRRAMDGRRDLPSSDEVTRTG